MSMIKLLALIFLILSSQSYALEECSSLNKLEELDSLEEFANNFCSLVDEDNSKKNSKDRMFRAPRIGEATA